MSIRSGENDVQEATEEQMSEGIQRALKRLDLTFEQLEAQARENKFSSEEARLVWFAISPRSGCAPSWSLDRDQNARPAPDRARFLQALIVARSCGFRVARVLVRGMLSGSEVDPWQVSTKRIGGSRNV